MTYNYLREETKDVIDYIKNELTFTKRLDLLASGKQQAAEDLNEKLFNVDSITGNGSGSYTFNVLQAERNLVGNWEILRAAIDELDSSFDAIYKGPEACDVLIRIYLLPTAIDDAITELWHSDNKTSNHENQ